MSRKQKKISGEGNQAASPTDTGTIGTALGPDTSGIVFYKDDPYTDVSKGPVEKREFTDVVWSCVFLLAFLTFMTVTYAGYGGGSPMKLISPRDFRGNYCGLKDDHSPWPGPKTLEKVPALNFMMNISGTIGDITTKFMCSNAVEEALRKSLGGLDMAEYMCACCKNPCKTCDSALHFEDEEATPSALAKAVQEKMADLTNPMRVLQLFSIGGANRAAFNSVLLAMDAYFVRTCTRQCDYTGYNESEHMRTYVYRPAPDSPWRRSWDTLLSDNQSSSMPLRDVATNAFKFLTLPESECPYAAMHCVPFPGIGFGPSAGSYCALEVASDVASAMGSVVGEIRNNHKHEDDSSTLGSFIGDALESWDALTVVFFVTMFFGFTCMVLFRFFIRVVVLVFLVCVPCALLAGGIAAFITSDRCNGENPVQSGKTYASAWGNSWVAWNSGYNASSEDEILTGDGTDYRGMQSRTRSGRVCQRWDSQYPHKHPITAEAYPDAGLDGNFCRNPGSIGVSVWCFTSDPKTRWELCQPLGSPTRPRDCLHGHAVEDADMRHALKVIAVVLLLLAAIWVFTSFCLLSRVKLALRVFEAAAVFVYEAPSVVLVPFVQAVVALLWVLFWFYSAAALLAQVPPDHVPSEAMTLTEAFGSTANSSPCSFNWPFGFAWHTSGDDDSSWDECSGTFGDTRGMTPRCWMCAPPRYTLDFRSLVSVCMLFWVSEIIVAAGICIVAGTCATWFFRLRDQRSRRTDSSVLVAGAKNAFVFHFGSLALGAAIVTPVIFVRWLVMYARRQADAKVGRLAMPIQRCVVCCLWIFETCSLKFMGYLSKKSYIHVALLGTPFCASAQSAFLLIARHPTTFLMLSVFGNCLRLVGVVSIVVSSVLVGFMCLRIMHPEISPVLPVFAFFLFAYIAAQAFLNVFGLAGETILQCVLANREMELPDKHLPIQLRGLQHVRVKCDEDVVDADAQYY